MAGGPTCRDRKRTRTRRASSRSKTLDSILFPSLRGDRGVVTFAAAALVWKRVGARVELAQLNTGGSRVNARGLRLGLTAR